MRPIIYANFALLAAVMVHGIDHYRQERGVGALNTEVVVGGALVWALVLVSLYVAFRHPARAGAVCGGIGAYIALGVTAAHFMPEWSGFSDPYAGLGLDWFSWVAAALEVAAGAALAFVGLRDVARHRTASA
jgi:hypothetical protein